MSTSSANSTRAWTTPNLSGSALPRPQNRSTPSSPYTPFLPPLTNTEASGSWR